jgi:tetratricopeptide (TPR) repeat protein
MAATDRDRAQALYEESVVLARSVDDGWLVSAALNNLGGLYLHEGAYERAIELFEESLAIGEARGDLDRRARELTNLGHAVRGLGDLTRARAYFRSGLAAAAEIGLIQIELGAVWGLASYEAVAGDVVVAARLVGWVNEQFARLGASADTDDIALEESLRDRLGRERLSSELTVGAALTREDAIDLAVRTSDPAAPG